MFRPIFFLIMVVPMMVALSSKYSGKFFALQMNIEPDECRG